MAPRKKKETAADEDSGGKAKASEVMKVISGPKLKKLMAAKRQSAQDASEINGNFGSEVKSAIQNDNLHRGAFTLIARLDRMEPESLRNFMDNFEYYFDVSGLKKRSESVMRMPLDEQDDEEGGNVHKFPAAAE